METRNSLREKSRSTLLYRYNLCFHTEANVPTWQDCFICTYSPYSKAAKERVFNDKKTKLSLDLTWII